MQNVVVLMNSFSFFEKLQLGQEPTESIRTYFVPKLTEKELELVEKKDSNYFKNFSWWMKGLSIVENKMSQENLSEAKYSCKFTLPYIDYRFRHEYRKQSNSNSATQT